MNPNNDPLNLVELPQSYHSSLHTNKYHIYVTERLRLVEGSYIGVSFVLVSLRCELLLNSKLGTRW